MSCPIPDAVLHVLIDGVVLAGLTLWFNKKLKAHEGAIRLKVEAQLKDKQGEIDQKVQQHKHELDKAVAAAALKANHVFEIVPQVWIAVLDAYLSVTMTDPGVSPDLANATNEEIADFLTKEFPYMVRSGLDKVFADIEGKPFGERFGKLCMAVRPLKIGKKMTSLSEANGLVQRNRVFLNADVFSLATGILNDLSFSVNAEQAAYEERIHEEAAFRRSETFNSLAAKQLPALHDAICVQIDQPAIRLRAPPTAASFDMGTAAATGQPDKP